MWCWCNQFAEKIPIYFPKNGRGDQRPFENFPKIHQFWRAQASLRKCTAAIRKYTAEMINCTVEN